MNEELKRCPWCGTDPLYQAYHDEVWGRPVRDDQILFEKLCLDGQQAGLSWITILRKQQTYELAYDQFDAEKIIHYGAEKIESLLQDPGIVRNKLKVNSIIKNAKGFLEIQRSGESFSDYIWSFVDGKVIQNKWRTMTEIPTSTPASEAMSKSLKKRGFTFVGPTICYAFMEAVGLVNDHIVSCDQWQVCRELER